MKIKKKIVFENLNERQKLELQKLQDLADSLPFEFEKDKKLEYWDIIEYGIDSIGKKAKISDIEKAFKGKAKVFDDDNMEVWATNHAYLDQEHLCLSFEDSKFNGLIDFDLMPDDNNSSIFAGLCGEAECEKKLVNFKAQIFGKRAFLWRRSLNQTKKEVLLNLKKQYGVPNNFDKFDVVKKKEFVKMDQLLREQYTSFGANPDEIQFWYIEKQGIYYCVSFYYFNGKREMAPFLSFAISEIFKIDE